MTTYDEETRWTRMLRQLGSCRAVPCWIWLRMYPRVWQVTPQERPDDHAMPVELYVMNPSFAEALSLDGDAPVAATHR